MDISKRHFKIIEQFGRRFTVCVELPRYKVKRFLGFAYGEGWHDEEDLFWGVMGADGTPLSKYEMVNNKPQAEFKSMSAAREFIEMCKQERTETIV